MTYNPEFIDILDTKEKIYKYYQVEYHKDANISNESLNWNVWSSISRDASSLPIIEHYPEKICWNSLAQNPGAVYLLEKNLKNIILADDNDDEYLLSNDYPDKIIINTQVICENPNAINFIEKKLKYIGRNGWLYLSANPNAIELIKKNMDDVELNWLCYNRNAFDIIKKKFNYILNDNFYLSYLSSNKNPKIIELIKKNFNKIKNKNYLLDYIASNPLAIDLIEENINNLSNSAWSMLSGNSAAIHLIEKNMDKICWQRLSRNPAALHILEQNYDNISWEDLLEFNTNPKKIYFIEKELKKLISCGCYFYEYFSTFFIKYQYEKIKSHFYNTFGKELVEKLYHPSNAHKWQKDCWNI